MSDIDLANYPDTLDAFGGDEQRADVFLDRYAARKGLGDREERTPEAMWGRVAVAMDDYTDEVPVGDKYVKFFRILKDFKFVPGGRILAGAGLESEVTFYNCYVIPIETRARRKNRQPAEEIEWGYEDEDGQIVEGRRRIPPTELDPGNDSREAIFDTIGLMVDIMSRGGGVGINWSVLRPKGAYLKRVNGTSSGPVGWMDVASKAVGEVEQGGSRRGAAMFMLDVWHPDVMEFINAKRDLKRITNANVSVAVSDDFMDAVREDRDWVFEFPSTADPQYNESWDGDLAGWKARGGLVESRGSLPARQVWRALAEAAWASGEPGVVFLDRYNARSTGAGVERLISVNPCGEQGLGAYAVCNLGSMNLQAYVRDHSIVEDQYTLGAKEISHEVGGYGPQSFDYDEFAADVEVAVEFLDTIIDKTFYFIPENEAIQKDLRRIGLGTMGLADALISLGIRYGSPEAVEFTEAVYRVMKDRAIEMSMELARRLGPAPAWRESMLDQPYLAEYLERKPDQRKYLKKHGLRNLFLLTQAPTGTTSILAGVNSGIEPLFAFEYTRKDRTGTHRVKAPAVRRYEEKNSIGRPPAFVGTYPDYFVTAADVTVEEHIAMQAAAQKYIDSSVSKTINAPYEHTVEDVEKAYTLAYESGLKGLAYFRDGCGRDQVLYRDDPMSDQAKADLASKDARIADLEDRVAELTAPKPEWSRPDVLTGRTAKIATKFGSAYVTTNRDSAGRPVEVFINIGNSGEDVTAMGEALGRIISLALRKGATLGGVANQLEGVGGMTNLTWNKSIPHAVGEALTAENKRSQPGVSITFDAEAGTAVLSGEITDFRINLGRDVEGSFGGDLEGDFCSEKDADLDDEDDYGDEEEEPRGLPCPGCGEPSLVREEGCAKCHACGYSAC